MKEKGIYEDTAIIISSDHGENLGELGIYSEHGTADAVTCRIPLIIKWPGVRSSGPDKGFHYNLDFSSTIDELLGGDGGTNPLSHSFASSVLTNTDSSRPYLVISQCAHVCQRSIRWGQWLYIKTWHDGYHLFPDSMLFDIENDPHEIHDLAQNLPMICQQAEIYLEEWQAHMQSTMPDKQEIDPMITVLKEGGPFHARGKLKTYIERLEKTNRGWAVSELISKHPEEFKYEEPKP